MKNKALMLILVFITLIGINVILYIIDSRLNDLEEMDTYIVREVNKHIKNSAEMDSLIFYSSVYRDSLLSKAITK
jgi:hypothetical protein